MKAAARVYDDERTGRRRLEVVLTGDVSQLERSPEWCAQFAQKYFAKFMLAAVKKRLAGKEEAHLDPPCPTCGTAK